MQEKYLVWYLSFKISVLNFQKISHALKKKHKNTVAIKKSNNQSTVHRVMVNTEMKIRFLSVCLIGIICPALRGR